MAATHRERILIVSGDPGTTDLVARQSLQPAHYRVRIATSATQALQEFVKFAPDLVVVDLALPDLSAKDLLAAWQAQRYEVPVIIMAPQGRERDIIQSFRLGAIDYLTLPARAPEIVAVVERALKLVRERRERAHLARRLEQTNQTLRRRLDELNLLFNLAKDLPGLTQRAALYQRLVDEARKGIHADAAWLAIREGRQFRLAAYANIPQTWVRRAASNWDDGLTSLVSLSGEPLNIHGEPLRRFKASHLGQAALVVPIQVKEQVIGVLGVARKALQPFTTEEQALLQGIADLAAMALVNLELFRALDKKAQAFQRQARAAQVGERLKSEALHSLAQRLQAPVKAALEQAQALLNARESPSPVQRQHLLSLMENLNQIQELVAALASGQYTVPLPERKVVDWGRLVKQVVERNRERFEEKHLRLNLRLPRTMLPVSGDPALLEQQLEGILGNVLQFTPPGGQVWVQMQRQGGKALLMVRDTGIAVPQHALAHVLTEPAAPSQRPSHPRDEGPGSALTLVQEIARSHKGRAWVESDGHQGVTFWVELPVARS